MTRAPSCPDILLARACRDALSPLEEERLAAHLRRCAACRVAKVVAADFERVPAVLPGDDALIARVTNRAVHRPDASRRRVRVFALIAAALLVVCAAAAAALSGRIAGRWLSPAAKISGAPSAPGLVAPARISAPAAPAAPADDRAPPSPSSAPVSAPRDRGPARPHGPEAREGDEETASSLFGEANRLRGAGQASEAIARYRQLQAVFPVSTEALLSRVSFGNLLLGRGDAEPALEQFKAYLSANPSGVLGAEALFGEARALRAMRRSSDERAAWRALLSTYPESVYAPVARERVEELR